MHDFIQLILSLLQRGLRFVVPAVLICVLGLTAAWIIFRKKKRPFPWKKAVALLMLIGWFGLTVFVTILRGETGFRQWNFHLFLAWKEAWNSFTLQIWLNLLLNIALFIPLGVLAPLLLRCFRRWYWMLTAGFGTSLLIETAQLITCKGIFDVDDLFANTLGTMLGWGVLMAILTLGNRKEGWKKRSAAYLSVPIVFFLVMAFIWIGYMVQPYGNLPDAPVVTGNLKDVQWELDFSPGQSPSTAQVYQVGRLDKADSEAFGAEFAEKLGITFEDVYYYDDTIIFANHFSGDFLNLNQRDGTWEYRIGRDLRPVFDKSPADISSEEVRAILLEWGISVPQDASFSIEFPENGFSQASFTAELISAEGKLFHGTLTCDFQQEEDGALKMVSVDNRMVVFSPCKEEPILTPEQAVDALYSGHSFEGYLLERNDITQIRILSCTLDWMADTKGFYQPVYRFTLQISDQDTVTDYVAALK